MNDKRYYVYALLDPRKSDEPFYIGKGTNDRCYQHLDGRCTGENRFKDHVIGAIRNEGMEPTVKFLSENLTSDDAYTLETKYIKECGRRNIDSNGILTNICLDKRPPIRKGCKISDEQRNKLKGRIPWNKGLTKETNESVKNGGKKIAESLKGNVPWNKGLDCSDPRIKKVTEELAKMNKGRIPWNKGTKGVMKPNSGSWGNVPAWNKMSLTQDFIDKIINDKRTQVKIAEEYNISQSLVSAIKLGKKKAE